MKRIRSGFFENSIQRKILFEYLDLLFDILISKKRILRHFRNNFYFLRAGLDILSVFRSRISRRKSGKIERFTALITLIIILNHRLSQAEISHANVYSGETSKNRIYSRLTYVTFILKRKPIFLPFNA